jgi:hypothetical protein
LRRVKITLSRTTVCFCSILLSLALKSRVAWQHEER